MKSKKKGYPYTASPLCGPSPPGSGKSVTEASINPCPYCATDPGCCCRALESLRAKRRAIERRQYAKNPEKFREKARRSYAKRYEGVSGPLPESDPT